MDRPQKGLALIINNLHGEQTGTEEDVKNLEKMFKKIGIDTDEVKINQTKEQVAEICADLEKKNLKDYNMFFLVVISHGVKGDKIKCKDSTVFGLTLPVWVFPETVLFKIKHFSNCLQKNEDMHGHPKLLFFDFCRGKEYNTGQNRVKNANASLEKNISTPKIPIGSDIFIGFATTIGYYSLTKPCGSPFITSLCSEMERFYNEKTFNYIFQEVQINVSQEISKFSKGSDIIDAMQVPESRSTLILHLYLKDKGNITFLAIFVCFLV